jgi:hypothetical protein
MTDTEMLYNLVRTEIILCFTLEEIKSWTFEEFWEQVDVTNAYEEVWTDWLQKGIKDIYKQVYTELRRE